MSRRKIHADRNKALAEKLFNEGEYYDWVVTTCFYSAIHLVEDIILPCIINGITCKNIDEVKRVYGCRGRHPARSEMVNDKKQEVHHQYDWLDDQSRNSRYKTFKISKAVAEKSIQYLTQIYEV